MLPENRAVGRLPIQPWRLISFTNFSQLFCDLAPALRVSLRRARCRFLRLRPKLLEHCRIVVANYPQLAVKVESLFARRLRRLGRSAALLRLLAAFGILSITFSAISPDDDDIQQEFFQSGKSKQCVLADYKAVSSLLTFRICTIRSALAPPTPQSASYYVTARVSVPDDEIKSRVCSRTASDRSPPAKSS